MKMLGYGRPVRPQIVVVPEETFIAIVSMELGFEFKYLGVAGACAQDWRRAVLPEFLSVSEDVERIALLKVPPEGGAVGGFTAEKVVGTITYSLVMVRKDDYANT